MLDKSIGLSPIGIGLLMMFLLHIPCHGQSVINVTEGQNLTLECGIKINHHWQRKWIVTSSGQKVSTCDFEGCFNSYPNKFLASLKRELSYYRRPRSIVLEVFNVTRDLSRIECGSDQWDLMVTAKSSSLTLTSDYGSEDISVPAGSHVCFMCKITLGSDGLDPGSMILYRDDFTNVLYSTSSSESLTYFLGDLVCGSSFVVGCQEEHLSAVEMKVRVEKCLNEYEDASPQSDDVTFPVNDGEQFDNPIARSSPIINSIGIKVGLSLACILILIVIILIVIVLCRRAQTRSRKHQQDNPPAYSDIFFINPTTELPDYASLPPPYNETIAQQQ
ncbi:hypothetical protein BgiBS90_003032 [Biomphalaria glabrata]|nr:hypothetical protein BgiBS90_003032 [Biomphalaria glabrata]